MKKKHIINLQLFAEKELTIDEAMIKISELSTQLQKYQDTVQAKEIEATQYKTEAEKLTAEIQRVQQSNLRLFNMVEEQTLGQLSTAPQPQNTPQPQPEEQQLTLEELTDAFK